MKHESVSVAVVVRNEEKDIEQCLQSLLTQHQVADEIIIVDSSSTDKTSDICKTFAEQHSDVQYCCIPHKGIGYARKEAVLRASGMYIAFLDGDCIAPQDWLSLLYTGYIVHKKTDQYLAGVGGSHTSKDDANRFQSVLSLLKTSLFASGSSAYRHSVAEDMYVYHIPTANVLYERSALLETLPDEDFSVSNEDVDISFRLTCKGFTLMQIKGSIVYHKMQRSMRGWWGSMVKYGYGKMQLLTKHKSLNLHMSAFLLPMIVLIAIPFLLMISAPALLYLGLLYILIVTFESTRLALQKRSLYTFGMLLVLFPATHLAYALGEILFFLPIPFSLKKL